MKLDLNPLFDFIIACLLIALLMFILLKCKNNTIIFQKYKEPMIQGNTKINFHKKDSVK